MKLKTRDRKRLQHTPTRTKPATKTVRNTPTRAAKWLRPLRWDDVLQSNLPSRPVHRKKDQEPALLSLWEPEDCPLQNPPGSSRRQATNSQMKASIEHSKKWHREVTNSRASCVAMTWGIKEEATQPGIGRSHRRLAASAELQTCTRHHQEDETNTRRPNLLPRVGEIHRKPLGLWRGELPPQDTERAENPLATTPHLLNESRKIIPVKHRSGKKRPLDEATRHRSSRHAEDLREKTKLRRT